MDNSNWIQDPESLMRSVEKAINRGISKELDRIFVETVEKEKRALEKEQQMDMLDGINTYTVPIEQGTWLWALIQLNGGKRITCDEFLYDEDYPGYLHMRGCDISFIGLKNFGKEDALNCRNAVDYDGEMLNPNDHIWRVFDIAAHKKEVKEKELRDKLSKLDKERMELEQQLNNL